MTKINSDNHDWTESFRECVSNYFKNERIGDPHWTDVRPCTCEIPQKVYYSTFHWRCEICRHIGEEEI